MKKIFFLLLSTLILAACDATTDSTEPAQTTDVNADIGKQLEPTSINNGATVTDKALPPKDEALLTNEEALAIANETIKQLSLAAYPEQVGGYVLDHSNYFFNEGEVEEILRLKTKLVRPYATQSFINTNIPVDEFNCRENCEILLPNDLYYAWKPRVENVTDEQFQIIAFVSHFDMTVDNFNSFEQTLDFVLEDGTWKMNGLTHVQKDLNLKVDEIEAYMQKNITINTTNEVFDYEGRDELVYNVTDNESGMVILLFARNGNYLYTDALSEPLAEEEGYYSFDNEYDYLSYTLFDYYHSVLPFIQINNPKIRDAVYELDNLTGGITTAMDFHDIEQLENYLTEAASLYDTLYNDFNKNWSASERDYFEASHETFEEELNQFITVYLADAPQAERLGYQALAITYNGYVLLSEQSR